MHAPRSLRPKPNRARITSWARLWLACIATLLNCAAHLLPPSHRRRLPLLDLPRAVLARLVARLIFICALERATPPTLRRRPHQRGAPQAGVIRALLRAGVQRHLVNARGEFDLARIARTCADPEAAIADMIAALEAGLRRRSPLPPRAARETLRTQAPIMPAHACDSS